MTTKISKELLAAYAATEYWVTAAPEPFCLTIGRHSPPLASLLVQSKCRCAAFVTACNPMSESRAANVNAAAHARLREVLAEQCAVVVEGAGRDPTGRWPEEPSFLALGLELDAARRVGEAFRQNAVVWAGSDAVPQLILLR